MKWLEKALAKFRGKVDLTEPVEETPEVTPNRAMRRAKQRQVKRMVAQKFTIPQHIRAQRLEAKLDRYRRRIARLSPERVEMLARRAIERRVVRDDPKTPESDDPALDEAILRGD